ncbi:MAG: biopolymer transporter ExbD [Burkholderiaceae bacterium]|nr:biopolymer transporter ExbD [Burkholderiaceae bacterium]
MPAIASRGRGRRTMNEINMVPFIDVMLVLLIIFMVTAPMLTPGLVDVPTVGKASKQPVKFASVMIAKDGSLQVQMGDTPVRSATEKEAVQAILQWQKAQSDAAAAVIIAADKAVMYESVVKTMGALQKAGVQRVGLSVKQGG